MSKSSFLDYDTYLDYCSGKMIDEPTYSERVAKGVLIKNHIRFKQQAVIKTSTKGYIVDFLLIDFNAVIEIDGGYHNKPQQIKKDNERDKDLRNSGYAVYRISSDFSSGELIEEIQTIIDKELEKRL